MMNLLPDPKPRDLPTDATSTAPAARSAGSVGTLALFGGGFDTANLGVGALTESCVRGLSGRLPGAKVIVFDHTAGTATADLPEAVGSPAVRYTRAGGRWSKMLWRRDSLNNIELSMKLGGVGNPVAKRLLGASAILDISGGDSFSDIYGQWRYDRIVQTKRMALNAGLPLILLPQTYGPFKEPRNKETAADLVRRSAQAWARDARSFEILKDLAGADFDPERHRQGTDVAFGLPPRRPQRLPNDLSELLADRGTPVVGLNVSGLILNDLEKANRDFGFRADYGQLVRGLLRKLLDDSDARVLLVPHVIRPLGHFESDPQACKTLYDELSPGDRRRVSILPSSFDQGEIKWVIGQCDWFCGTRMHSTIAALSSGVPTAAIAYSIKTQGIFDACDSGDAVSDPMKLDTSDAGEVLWSAWQNRSTAKDRLAAALVDVKAKAAAQMDAIAAACVR